MSHYTVWTHATWLYVRHDYFRLTAVVAWCAFATNFMPSDERLCKWPRVRASYSLLCDIISALALNWRRDQPSLKALPEDHPYNTECEDDNS